MKYWWYFSIEKASLRVGLPLFARLMLLGYSQVKKEEDLPPDGGDPNYFAPNCFMASTRYLRYAMAGPPPISPATKPVSRSSSFVAPSFMALFT